MTVLRLFVAGPRKRVVWSAWRNLDGSYQWLPGELIEQARAMMAAHPEMEFGDPVLEQIEGGGLERGMPHDSGYLVMFPGGESD